MNTSKKKLLTVTSSLSFFFLEATTAMQTYNHQFGKMYENVVGLE